MTILITGANGQLGTELKKLLDEKEISYYGADSNELDITNKLEVDLFIEKNLPTVIYHCAAYTAVDNAEDEGKELNQLINVDGTRYVAQAAERIGATFVYISTDYIFDGKNQEQYQVDDQPNPQNEYGRSKYEGELEVEKYCSKYYIIRTSWVYGGFGSNFVFTMQKLAEKNSVLTIVNDQIGRPTWTRDLAEFMLFIVDKKAEYGIYHFSNDNECSWFEFAKEILKDKKIEITPVDSASFSQKAHRPMHSILDLSKSKELGFTIQTWQVALQNMLDGLNK